MDLRSLTFHELELELREPFQTSFGTERTRRLFLIELEARDGLTGWGECVASREPLYSEESTATALAFLRGPVLERWRTAPPSRLVDLRELLRAFRGNRMAKAALEQAAVYIEAQRAHRTLADWWGANRRRVEVGVSVGIQPSVSALVRRVGRYLESGYRRIKVKVRPGWDQGPLRALRREYPDLRLWADANQAYPARAIPRIRAWATAAEVEQVEQPFAERAIAAHAELARGALFRVCLDESIVDRESLEEARRAGAFGSLNVKPGRVGGPIEALRLARTARRGGARVWVGGMLESGVGRAHNLHVAARREFGWPGDISASDRYYETEIIDRPFRLGPGSTLEVPRGPGIGVAIDRRALLRVRRAIHRYALPTGDRRRAR